ncbi:hypothetical protein J7E97_22455 [Streptomyces sp. ISL-66]|uniref:hypothetical protein n=1 Tax=Streptomyces sp. ISL-66 TaxID=2819186 RepID=UPI001BE8A41F|nr:hypothetical protein [Streptomyces sp. ISL-66]MBT2470554.1 hypothetical protein [Streptomyces sp. ISL-66]
MNFGADTLGLLTAVRVTVAGPSGNADGIQVLSGIAGFEGGLRTPPFMLRPG